MNEKIKGKAEFMALARAVMPHIQTIQQIMQEAGLDVDEDSFASIIVGMDGFFSFNIYPREGVGNWRLCKMATGEPRIEYDYAEEIEIEIEEAQ